MLRQNSKLAFQDCGWFAPTEVTVPILDVTGADVLDELHGELKGTGIVLAVARAKGLFRVMLERTGVAEKIGREHMFPTVRAGAQAFLEGKGKSASDRYGK